jgi:NAD(P)H-hydrate epimerase
METPQPVHWITRLLDRPEASHKGDFGRALLIGGSRGMSGAIALAGMAALRGGAGLVKLAVPDACLDTIAAIEPSYITVPLACDKQGRIALAAQGKIEELASDATCVACGPGLGRSDELDQLVASLYRSLSNPMVVDADGLNALATRTEQLGEHAGPRIITPHPGEFRRLSAVSDVSPEEMVPLAAELAAMHDLVVVLKGHRTLIADPTRQARNPTGNPGMATGGTGDVLTGLLVALVCQNVPPFEAAQLAVYLHGLAGDLAAIELGQPSLIASDLVDFLPCAFLEAAD